MLVVQPIACMQQIIAVIGREWPLVEHIVSSGRRKQGVAHQIRLWLKRGAEAEASVMLCAIAIACEVPCQGGTSHERVRADARRARTCVGQGTICKSRGASCARGHTVNVHSG